MPPARPEQQTTAEQEAARRKLIAEIAAIVAVVATAELAAGTSQEMLARAGMTYERIVAMLRRTFTAGAVATIIGVRMMARIRTATNAADALYDERLVELLAQQEYVYAVRHAREGVRRVVQDMVKVAVEKEEQLLKAGKTFDGLSRSERREVVADLRDKLAGRLVESVTRERQYAQMRTDAVARRLDLRVEEEGVQRASPEGAYWVLDMTKRTHTKDCVAMANKAWTWRVLAIVRPSNRHLGCGCRLYTLDFARATAMPNSTRVRDRVPAAALHGH